MSLTWGLRKATCQTNDFALLLKSNQGCARCFFSTWQFLVPIRTTKEKLMIARFLWLYWILFLGWWQFRCTGGSWSEIFPSSYCYTNRRCYMFFKSKLFSFPIFVHCFSKTSTIRIFYLKDWFEYCILVSYHKLPIMIFSVFCAIIDGWSLLFKRFF